eukprot:242755-Rhodomonas_salina.1
MPESQACWLERAEHEQLGSRTWAKRPNLARSGMAGCKQKETGHDCYGTVMPDNAAAAVQAARAAGCRAAELREMLLAVIPLVLSQCDPRLSTLKPLRAVLSFEFSPIHTPCTSIHCHRSRLSIGSVSPFQERCDSNSCPQGACTLPSSQVRSGDTLALVRAEGRVGREKVGGGLGRMKHCDAHNREAVCNSAGQTGFGNAVAGSEPRDCNGRTPGPVDSERAVNVQIPGGAVGSGWTAWRLEAV